MSTIYELLDQDVYWEPKGKSAVLIKDMAPTHIHNLLAWLERRAPRLKQVYEYEMIISAAGPLGPGGDMACDAFDSACEQLWEQPVLEWLNEFPLVQKLRELQRDYRAAEIKLAKVRNLTPAGATSGLDRSRRAKLYRTLERPA